MKKNEKQSEKEAKWDDDNQNDVGDNVNEIQQQLNDTIRLAHSSHSEKPSETNKVEKVKSNWKLCFFFLFFIRSCCDLDDFLSRTRVIIATDNNGTSWNNFNCTDYIFMRNVWSGIWYFCSTSSRFRDLNDGEEREEATKWTQWRFKLYHGHRKWTY